MMTVDKVNAQIAKLYQAKLLADEWVNAGKRGDPIRFDRFVLRYFMQIHGTRGVARRYLRQFIEAAQHHASPSQPRILLFCVVVGIPVGGTDFIDYNPRLSTQYFLPTMRGLFPDPRTIEECLAGKQGRAATCHQFPRAAIMKCAIPYSLQYLLGGGRFIAMFHSQLKRLSAKNGKGRFVDFDEALLKALPLWRFSDAMRVFRRQFAVEVLQGFFRRRRQRAADAAKAKQQARESLAAQTNLPKLSAPGVGMLPGMEPLPQSAHSSQGKRKLSDAKELDERLNPRGSGAGNRGSLRQRQPIGGRDDLSPLPAVTKSGGAGAMPTAEGAAPRLDPDVTAFLKELNLLQYSDLFAREEMDMQVLKCCTDSDLEALGLTRGARIKIMHSMKVKHL